MRIDPLYNPVRLPLKKRSRHGSAFVSDLRSENNNARETDLLRTRKSHSAFAAISSLLLIPLLCIQPLFPLYAFAQTTDAETVTPPAEELAPSPEPPPSPAPEEPTPEESASEEISPSQENQDTPPETEEVVPEEASDETLSDTEEATDVPPEDSNEHSDSGDELLEGTQETTEEIIEEEIDIDPASYATSSETGNDLLDDHIATTTPDEGDLMTPPSEGSVVESATATEEATTSDEISEQEDGGEEESAGEILMDDEEAEEANAREQAPSASLEQDPSTSSGQALREQLRKEVEEEFLRGCISFEQSGYYCLKNADGTAIESKKKETPVLVSAEPGPNGNKEIMFTKYGNQVQITDNEWEDAFPAKDISGKRLVWQGQKDGRWQIFFANVSDPEAPVIFQVTDSEESNFNPKVDGNTIIWQGWVNDNWEIFLATKRDGNSPFASEHLPEGNALRGVGAEWEVERLTENTMHDMFPSIHGDIITWQTHEGESWAVYAYSIREKTQTKLSSEGSKSENPRFSITWEERGGDGYARIMSYDMATGEKTDLTEEAKHIPDLPTSEQFPTPISQSNQAALPGAGGGIGTSTPMKDGDGGGGGEPQPTTI